MSCHASRKSVYGFPVAVAGRMGVSAAIMAGVINLNDIPTGVYKLVLFVATIIWGAAFVVMKDAVEVLGPAQLVGIRFLLAGLLLVAIFHKKVRRVVGTPGGLRAGVIMGAILFVAFWLQTLGLAYTMPGVNAFLTATYCVIVPFMLWAATRRFPGVARLAAALICVAGIGLVSVVPGSFSIGFGDGITLLGAVVFALEIVCISHFTKTYSAVGITAIQFVCCGTLGLVCGALFEPVPDWAALLTPEFAGQLAYLVVLSSCACYVAQNVGLAHVPAAPGALILSLESVFGVVFSVVLYGERLTLQMVCGFALIFIAILISELAPTKQPAAESS